DVWALGAIFYELLTGRRAFDGEQTADVLLRVLTEDPLPPGRLEPRLPRDLEVICLKCLQKEPRQRYASAQDLADDLGRFLSGQSIRARPIGTWGRLVKWTKRRPAVASLLALVAVVSAVGVGMVVWKWQEAVNLLKVATEERLAKEEAWEEQEKAVQKELAQKNV